MSKGREVFRAAILVGVLLGVSSNNKAEATAMADSDCLDAIVTWTGLSTIATAAWIESGATVGLMSAVAAYATWESTKAFSNMIDVCEVQEPPKMCGYVSCFSIK